MLRIQTIRLLVLLCSGLLSMYSAQAQMVTRGGIDFYEGSTNGLKAFQDYSQCYYGLLNARGDTICPAQFDDVYSFHCHGSMHSGGLLYRYWLVRKNGKQAIIGPEGSVILPLEYESILVSRQFRVNGLLVDWFALVRKPGSDNYGYANLVTGQVTPVHFSLGQGQVAASRYAKKHCWNGIPRKRGAMIYKRGKVWGVLDTLLQPVVESKHRIVAVMADSFFVVAQDWRRDKWKLGVVNTTGELIVPYGKRDLGVVPSSDGQRVVWQVGGRKLFGIYDKAGNDLLKKPLLMTHGSMIPTRLFLAKVPGLQVVQNRKRKWGAIDAKGRIVFPYAYDYILEHRNLSPGSENPDWVIMAQQNGLRGVVAQDRQLVPFRYSELEHRAISRDSIGEWLIGRDEDGFDLINFRGEIAVEGADSIFVAPRVGRNSRGLEYQRSGSRNKTEYFVLDSNCLHMFSDTGIVLLDSNYFTGSPRLITVARDLLVGRDGKVLKKGRYQWRIVGDNHVFWYKGEVGMLDPFGMIRFHYKHFKRTYLYKELALVETQEGLIGAIDLKTRNWVADTVYHAIHKNKLGIWLKTTPVGTGRNGCTDLTGGWRWTDRRGKSLSDLLFDEPIRYFSRELAFFKSEGRYGVLNRDQKSLVLPATYDAAYETADNQVYLRKDSLWGCVIPSGEVLEPQWNFIYRAEKGRFLALRIRETGLEGQVFSKNLEPLTDVLSENELIENHDLSKLLEFDPETEPFWQALPPDASANQRAIINRLILTEVMADEAPRERYRPESPNFNLQIFHNGKRSACLRQSVEGLGDSFRFLVGYSDSSLVSLARYSVEEIVHHGSIYRSAPSARRYKQEVRYLTLKASGNTLDTVSLKTAFLEQSGYHEYIYNRLFNAIDSAQAFGLRCVSVPDYIAVMMDNFTINENRILFHLPTESPSYRQADLLDYEISWRDLAPFIDPNGLFGKFL